VESRAASLSNPLSACSLEGWGGLWHVIGLLVGGATTIFICREVANNKIKLFRNINIFSKNTVRISADHTVVPLPETNVRDFYQPDRRFM
jgi:hypothetical protein